MKKQVDIARDNLSETARLTFNHIRNAIKRDVDEVVDTLGNEYSKQIAVQLSTIKDVSGGRGRGYLIEPHVLWITCGMVFVAGLVIGYILG